MFWKVAGYSQPSPLEQILNKEEFTLEELLDEEDIIQECKSLNGRLVAFLRERSTVEQLLRFLVVPAKDTDDPRRIYKYPFTACEVFCCDIEAVFNTLVEDADLMSLLFSLLNCPAPLNCKMAGYFGRVVGNLLLRKTSEVMQFLQDTPVLLEKLVGHVDTTSISDIIKRLVGADEQSSILFIPAYAQWLSGTLLVALLLGQLAHSASSEAQANAADILAAIAHTQPSPLAAKLTRDESISALFQHAMSPSKQVLVPALDVCIALIEPRSSQDVSGGEQQQLQLEESEHAKDEAVSAIVGHLPKLVDLLRTGDAGTTLETPYGCLAPRLGRPRLKIVELFAVLVRSGSLAAESAVMQSGAIRLCLELFAAYPFNNMLHHCVSAMLMAALTQSSEALLQHLVEQCQLLDWLIGLPIDIQPIPRPGHEEAAAAKSLIRAGYMGHVVQLGGALESLAQQGQPSSSGGGVTASIHSIESAHAAKVYAVTQEHAGWQNYLTQVLRPRLDLENTARWACGRPASTELAGLDSDGDDYQHDMDLEQIQGMQQTLYHRYSSVDENDEDDDDEGREDEEFKSSAFGAHMITEAMLGMDLNDGDGEQQPEMQDNSTAADEDGGSVNSQAAASSSESTPVDQQQQSMDDDAVLLATSDEDEGDVMPLEGVGASDGGTSSGNVEEDAIAEEQGSPSGKPEASPVTVGGEGQQQTPNGALTYSPASPDKAAGQTVEGGEAA